MGTKGAQQAHTRQQQTTNDPLTHLPRAVLQASCHRYCLPTERLAGRRILRAHSGQYWLRQFVYRAVTSAEQAESELRQGQREIMLQREPQFPGTTDPHHSQRVQTPELASLGARQKAKHPGARQKATHPRQARSDLIRQSVRPHPLEEQAMRACRHLAVLSALLRSQQQGPRGTRKRHILCSPLYPDTLPRLPWLASRLTASASSDLHRTTSSKPAMFAIVMPRNPPSGPSAEQ